MGFTLDSAAAEAAWQNSPGNRPGDEGHVGSSYWAVDFSGPFGLNGQPIDQNQDVGRFGPDSRFDHFTAWSILSLVGLALLCIWFTSRSLRTPAERER